MRQVLAGLKILVIPLLTVLILVAVLVLQQMYFPGVMSGPTGLAISMTPQSSIVVTTTLSYGDALKTYENVATSAIYASERALDMTKWAVGAIFALSTIAAAIAAYVYRASHEAGDKAERAEEAARSMREAAERTQDLFQTLLERDVDLSRRYLDLESRTMRLQDAIGAYAQGVISEQQYKEAQQRHYWERWKVDDNVLGFQELKESIDADGIAPAVRIAIRGELGRLSRSTIQLGRELSNEEKDYRNKLLVLLETELEQIKRS